MASIAASVRLKSKEPPSGEAARGPQGGQSLRSRKWVIANVFGGCWSLRGDRD